jgi:hypothetical protein
MVLGPPAQVQALASVSPAPAQSRLLYGTRSPLKKIHARGRIIFLFFPRAVRARALKIRQINSAILKVPDAAWDS